RDWSSDVCSSDLPPEDPAKLSRALAVVPQVRLVNGAVDLLLPPAPLFLLNRLEHDLLDVDRLELGHGIDHEGLEPLVLGISVGNFPEDLLQLPGAVDPLVMNVTTRGHRHQAALAIEEQYVLHVWVVLGHGREGRLARSLRTIDADFHVAGHVLDRQFPRHRHSPLPSTPMCPSRGTRACGTSHHGCSRRPRPKARQGKHPCTRTPGRPVATMCDRSACAWSEFPPPRAISPPSKRLGPRLRSGSAGRLGPTRRLTTSPAYLGNRSGPG